MNEEPSQVTLVKFPQVKSCMVALGTKPILKRTITSSNYHSAMMATLSYNALICPPHNTFCGAAKMMDANFS